MNYDASTYNNYAFYTLEWRSVTGTIADGLARCKELCDQNKECDAIYYGQGSDKHCGLCASGYQTGTNSNQGYQFYTLLERSTGFEDAVPGSDTLQEN